MFMSERPTKRYLFASDFDQTLSFNDSGYVLAELLDIPTAEFERKAEGMAMLNMVQQGGGLQKDSQDGAGRSCLEHIFTRPFRAFVV